jgi:hypothetical protein
MAGDLDCNQFVPRLAVAGVGDPDWQGWRSAAAASPQQERRNRSWRLGKALGFQPGVKQGVQDGGQLAVRSAHPDRAPSGL